jgi:hypothetical protein
MPVSAGQGARMKNGGTRSGRLIAATVITFATLLWLQPYSVISPYRAFTEPARRFLQAALARDSAELRRRAVSTQPVEWALQASNGDTKALAVWAKLSRPYSGHRHGDTTTVVFQTSTRVCYLRPVAMTFVRGPEGPRVLLASSSCFADR